MNPLQQRIEEKLNKGIPLSIRKKINQDEALVISITSVMSNFNYKLEEVLDMKLPSFFILLKELNRRNEEEQKQLDKIKVKK